MKNILIRLFIFIFVVNACTNKDKNLATKYLNSNNLEEQLFTINIHKDTNLVTQQGLKINIDANSIEASTTTVTIQVKEALTLEAILKAGLTTQTTNGILSSDGMFYIATKEESKIKKPFNISLPTITAKNEMQLYKGYSENGQIIWREPTKLETKKPTEPYGKTLFVNNCASCHNIKDHRTGPPLAWTNQRFGKSKKDKEIVYSFIDNSFKVIYSQRNLYYCSLYQSYNKAAMNCFEGVLTHDDYEVLYQYINTEAKRLNISELEGLVKDSCEYYHDLYYRLTLKRDSLLATNELMNSVTIVPSISNIPTFPLNVDTSQPITKPKDNVVPNIKYAEYYQFKIEAYGWYNIDVLLKEDDKVKESNLMVKLKTPVTLKANVFLVIPERKVFIEGGLLIDSSNYGFYTKDGKIPLPQGETIYLFAVGESNNKIYFSQTSFVAELSQTINLELKETNKTTMLNAIAQLKLTDIIVEVQEVKNYRGINSIDKALEIFETKLQDCSCGSRTDTSIIFNPCNQSIGVPIEY